MSQIIFQVDSFTDRPFQGNPAGVCVLSSPQDESWMQAVAQEMNLSETAFLHPEGDGYRLRWFTPTVEVDLCGHATLASAHTLWEAGYLASEREARFYTRSGLLKAVRQNNWIQMDFPAKLDEPVEPPAGLLEALGLSEALYIGKNAFDYIVEVDSEDRVRHLAPDFTRLGRLTVRGVMVTSRSVSPDFHFISRFFAPGAGIDEDPVTGSAHCCLAPYWQRRFSESGQEVPAEFRAFQASARGGILKLRVQGERVLILGQAVTVLKGELLA